MDEPERIRVVGELLRCVDTMNERDEFDSNSVVLEWPLYDRIREAMNGAILLLRKERKP